MTTSDEEMLTGTIFEETTVLTVGDLSRLCAIEERRIVEFVEEGVLEVDARAAAEWRFTGSALRKARMALRLERDFELSLAGIALVMELMEELEQLRRELSMRR
ncbi:MAG TPA: chaperone modulator CbpM [Steroidobacteraceae bacterium]|jgi:chaperone modulatory protein CbpM|nr:chaperone modulator CbpM [Steroidobacteraceae bacterium]